MKQRKVGIVLFEEVEVLDFAGPFEVLSLVSISENKKSPFLVKTISEDGRGISARNGLKVQPDYSFENAPNFDILIIPGGPGARLTEIHNEKMIEWIQQQDKKTEFTTSVCTGSLLLAKAGLLDGKKATTHWAAYDRLEKEFPNVEVLRDVKFVDEGRIITAGGISAGITMAFHLVERLAGPKVKEETAKRMEYDL